MTYREIRFFTKDALGFLVLNNPAKVNALSRLMIAEMTDALTRIGEDRNLKVLVIRAEGKNFCAGHYLAEMLGQNLLEYRAIFENCSRMMQMLHLIPQPVIAQVQGVATAAGCQLAAACDLAIAEENARFATPGVGIGLFCATPMVEVSRCIGRKAAMEMLLTGRFVGAAEAREMGLINRVVPKEELAAETEALAEKIAGASRVALSMGKKAFYAQIDLPEASAYSYASLTMSANNLAKDAQTGIQAFLDGTAPEWEDG